jgi:hypothetical protein
MVAVAVFASVGDHCFHHRLDHLARAAARECDVHEVRVVASRCSEDLDVSANFGAHFVYRSFVHSGGDYLGCVGVAGLIENLLVVGRELSRCAVFLQEVVHCVQVVASNRWDRDRVPY